VTAPWTDAGPDLAPPVGSFGRYRITRALGAGGIGVVVAAFDPDLGREVAIKFLQRAAPAAAAQLLAEARAMARLTHPNVVAIHEVVRIGERAGIVMELIDGPDLGRWQAAAPRSWSALVDAYVQAARGLAAAHRAGLVHRDFKPANALIDRDGVVRVTDFGLARTVDDEGPSGGGTPAYMAPEQRRGEPIDARTDQWALGQALTRALAERRAGRPPPAYVTRALARATAAAPAARFPTIDELIVALTPRRHRGWLTVAALAGVAAAAAAVVGLRASPPAPPTCAVIADRELAASWGPRPRIALTAAFARRGPAATATWARTDGALRDHAAAWRQARIDACVADRAAAVAPALSEVRRACLDRGRRDLAALAGALAAPSVETVTRAHAAALALDAPAGCLDLADLARREPVPEDAIRRPTVAAARAELAAARAAAELGQLPSARRQLAALADGARAHGWAPLTAEVLLDSGAAAAADRDFATAARLLDEAVLIAESVGYDRATARGLIALVDVRGRGQVRPADGLALVPRAQAVVTRIGGEPALAATLDTYRGRILLILGKYDEALAILRAVADARRALDPRHPEVASAEIDVADALQKLGRPAEALPHYQAALALRRELFGADHVLVARAVYSLGNGYVELGDYDRALASYQAALDAYQATFGPNHAMLAAALNNLGYANNLAGRPAAAVPLLERGLAIVAATDRDPINRALLEGNLGDALRRLGRLDQAEALLERSLVSFRAAYGPDNPQVIWSVTDLAELRVARGDRAGAVALLREAERLAVPLGPDHPLARRVQTRLTELARSGE
jgi:tetratricopeptide (TPR) repeat protein